MACLHPLTSRGASPFRLYTNDASAFALAGEIDLSAGQLAETLGRVLPLIPGSELVVDGRELEFIDHRGLLVLDRCAGQQGVRFALQYPSGDGGADRGGDRPATPARGRAGVNDAAPAGRPGFRHEAALYGSDEEFLAVAAPFLAKAIAAGEPTLLAVPAPLQRRVKEALGDPAGLTLLAGEQFRQPFSTLQRNYQMFLDHVGTGGRWIRQIRMIGAIPEPGIGTQWDGWVRYEAAINDLSAALPVWSVCPYDTRSNPAEVLDEVERTHPYLAAVDGGHRPNPR